MKKFSKTVVLFFSLLIAFLNSGFLKSNFTLESSSNQEGSLPSTHRFSIQNIFICPISDFVPKHNLIRLKAEKIVQKIKVPAGFKNGALTKKNHLTSLISEDQPPILHTDLFSPSDISFPFNYFW